MDSLISASEVEVSMSLDPLTSDEKKSKNFTRDSLMADSQLLFHDSRVNKNTYGISNNYSNDYKHIPGMTFELSLRGNDRHKVEMDTILLGYADSDGYVSAKLVILRPCMLGSFNSIEIKYDGSSIYQATRNTVPIAQLLHERMSVTIEVKIPTINFIFTDIDILENGELVISRN